VLQLAARWDYPLGCIAPLEKSPTVAACPPVYRDVDRGALIIPVQSRIPIALFPLANTPN